MRRLRGFTIFLAVFPLVLFGIAQAAEEPEAQVQVIEKKAPGFVPEKLLWMHREVLDGKIRDKAKGKDSFHLVDVRLEADYARGALEGAMNIPIAKMSFVAEALMAKTDEVILYGYPGNDRVTVNMLILLVNKGYDNVYVLKDGYTP